MKSEVKMFVYIALHIVSFYCTNIWGQASSSPIADRLDGYKRKMLLEQSSVVNHISLKSIGPNTMGGRVVDIEVNPADPAEFYVAYATGGVWYTSNNGQSLVPISDSLPVISIGDIAVDWKGGVVWVGTGEANAQRNALAGSGVYKTVTNGKSWEYCGLAESHHIGKILLDTRKRSRIWVAVMGKLHSYSRERGGYLSEDGGKSWKQSLFIDDSTGVIDLIINPRKPDEVFAASWSLLKPQPWSPRYSGRSSGIYKTKNGGKTWSLLTTEGSGFLQGDGVGRIGLAIHVNNPNIVYAVVDNRDSVTVEGKNITRHRRLVGAQVFQSKDGGNHWRQVNEQLLEAYNTYGWYFGKIYLSAADEQFLMIDGIAPMLSNDGGREFVSLSSSIHADQHAAWLNPKNENHLIVGNDGGVYMSYDKGLHWVHLNMPAVGQFYSVTVDDADVFWGGKRYYHVFGGLQDNHVWMGPSFGQRKLDESSILDGQMKDYYKLIGGPGDGMQVQVDSRDNDLVYMGLERGAYARKRLSTGEVTGIDARKFKARQNWETPILLSKHNPDILFYGSEKLYRSLWQGDSLVPISDDLTRGGKKYGNEWYGTLTTISESPLKAGVLYTGSDDGLMHVSTNNGVSWRQLNIPGVGEGLWVNRLVASRYDTGRVYAALSGYVQDDFSPYLFVSKDYGATWKRISNGLPAESIYVIREDPTNAQVLYIGTEGGLYVSMNGGTSWMAWNRGLPKSVPVRDIAIQERHNEIVLGTYGRSLYKASLTEVQGIAKTYRSK